MHLLPGVLVSLIGFWVFFKLLKEDVKEYHCITFKTLLITLAIFLASLMPVFNWICIVIGMIWLCVQYEYEIKEFVEQPICNWIPFMNKKDS